MGCSVGYAINKGETVSTIIERSGHSSELGVSALQYERSILSYALFGVSGLTEDGRLLLAGPDLIGKTAWPECDEIRARLRIQMRLKNMKTSLDHIDDLEPFTTCLE